MKQLINADPYSKIALEGYDPVAFHTVGRAIKGNPAFSIEYYSYKYLFSSEENKIIFEKEPEKYLPSYGGYCAYGVSLGILFPVDVSTWEIIDHHLVLQFSQDVKQKFSEQKEANIRQANENWSKMKETLASELKSVVPG